LSQDKQPWQVWGQDLSYVFDRVPNPRAIFRKIQELRGATYRQMYKNYGMGAYYTLFVESQYVDRVKQEAAKLGKTALDAGHTENGPKKVIIDPVGVEYSETELGIH
jgi:phosphoribosylformylglycinamidine cyclo-ligase